MKEIRSLQSEERLEESLRIPREEVGVSERGLGNGKFEKMRERSTEVSFGLHEVYLKTISKSRQIRCRGGVEPSVEQVSRKSNVDR